MRIRSCLPLILLATGTLAGPASGQVPAAGFWQELERAGSTAEVNGLVPARELDPELAEGMRCARRYAFSHDRADAYRGRELLQRAAARAPGDAFRQFALGAMLVRGPDARVRAFSDPDEYFISPHSLAYAQGVRALRRALALDSQLGAAALELLQLAVERGDSALAREASAALGRTPATGTGLLWEARAALDRNETERALLLSDRARSYGADVSLSQHTAAFALLQDPSTRSAGVARYFEGVRHLTGEGAREYFRAIGAIVGDGERAAWATAGLAERGEWLRRFWEHRAARAGVTLEQRLGEHYRRLQQARLSFRPESPMSDGAELSAIALGVDPRRFGLTAPGLMLMRHGDPQRLALLRHCQFGVAQLVKSRRAAGRLLDALVPPDAAEHAGDALVRTELPGDMRVVCMPGGDGQLARRLTERTLHQLAAGDSYEPPFTRRLAFVAATYAFRGPDDSTQLVAAVSLPTNAARELADASGVLTTRLSLILVQDSTRAVARSDRIERSQLPTDLLAPAAPRGLTLLHAMLNTSLRQRVRYRIALTDSTGEQAGAIVGGELTVPEFDGSGPRLSDVVLAPTDVRGTWRRGEVVLSPAPGRVYRAGEPVHLFYELYGVGEGERYRTEIRAAPERAGPGENLRAFVAGRRNVVSMEFVETAGVPHEQYGLQQARMIGTEYLSPGVYRVRVRVTRLGTGESAAREGLLEIVP
ncbi:MAG: hypothetical protein FIB01_14250 [Gemmatimonadetes bacterium]|nr:hypothetical protein [Gemmatimonadota bacterium]